jgi:chromosome partitioning protein
MKIAAVANQKGGVGKTTVVFHLAHCALAKGCRVLLVDLDPQGNCTTAFARRSDLLEQTGGSEQLFADGPVQPLVLTDHLHLLHGHIHLDAVDAHFDLLKAAGEWKQRLRTLPYDLILIDTPPSQGTKPVAALLWADRVIIPACADEWSFQGVLSTQAVISQVRRHNPTLGFDVILNRFRNLKPERELLALTGSTHPLLSFKEPHLTERVDVKLALTESKPVWDFRKAAPGLRTLWLQKIEELLP